VTSLPAWDGRVWVQPVSVGDPRVAPPARRVLTGRVVRWARSMECPGFVQRVDLHDERTGETRPWHHFVWQHPRAAERAALAQTA